VRFFLEGVRRKIYNYNFVPTGAKARQCRVDFSSIVVFFFAVDLTSRCKELEQLDVSGCGLVSGVGVTASPTSPHLPLQLLDMSDCARLDDTSLRLVVESCPQLQFLYLRRCTQISGIGFPQTSVSFLSDLRNRLPLDLR
jgi:hypothetical protein